MYTANLFCRADNRSFRSTDLIPKAIRHKVTKQRGNKKKLIIFLKIGVPKERLYTSSQSRI